VTDPADEPIRVAPYDSEWPARFNRERDLLHRAIGPWALGGIHHVGSTAVPGLDAKPIIDLLVGVEDLEVSRACFEPLADLGYLYDPYLADEMHWFCKPDPSRRTHHLHLVPHDSPRYRDELAFRDHLRESSEKARDYAELKHRLAARFEHDREGYTDAKADFIQRTLREAEAAGNEALIRRFYDELWNRWQLGLADELVSDALRFRGSLGSVSEGREDFKRYVEVVRAAFPDWHNRVDEMLAVDDRVVTRMTWSGTHRGVLGAIEPTGAHVEYSGAAFFRLSGGLIEEAWVVGDTQELWQALGLLSPSATHG